MRLHIGFAGILLSGILVLAMSVSGAAAEDEIENMLTNPDFENGTTGWSVLTIDKHEDPIGGLGQVAFAEIINVGPEAWNPEVHSPPFDLEQGKKYTMTFWAKAEEGSARTLGIKFEQLETWVGPSKTITLTDEWAEYSLTADWTNASSPPGVVIHIQFNLQLDDVWFSHFRVYEGEYVEEDIEGPQKKISVTPRGRLATAWGEIKSR